ncbi:MAG: hypothetical protein KDC46_16090, partial [Thermoleophilia bacterium]|nr:hypothetical protein [Thermoleophilia bacterium]
MVGVRRSPCVVVARERGLRPAAARTRAPLIRETFAGAADLVHWGHTRLQDLVARMSKRVPFHHRRPSPRPPSHDFRGSRPVRKLNVAILAGGRSSEHDISRLSALGIMDAIDGERYNVVPVLIERSGDWRLTSKAKLALPEAAPRPASDDHDEPSSDGRPLSVARRSEVRPATVTSPSNALQGVDVIFPVLHG